jgi:hypothetical protein
LHPRRSAPWWFFQRWGPGKLLAFRGELSCPHDGVRCHSETIVMFATLVKRVTQRLIQNSPASDLPGRRRRRPTRPLPLLGPSASEPAQTKGSDDFVTPDEPPLRGAWTYPLEHQDEGYSLLLSTFSASSRRRPRTFKKYLCLRGRLCPSASRSFAVALPSSVAFMIQSVASFQFLASRVAANCSIALLAALCESQCDSKQPSLDPPNASEWIALSISGNTEVTYTHYER